MSRPSKSNVIGRPNTVCHRCHRQKVKCSRETPCRNCRITNKICVYNVQDRNRTVSESYLRRLEAGIAGQSNYNGGYPTRHGLQPLTPMNESQSKRSDQLQEFISRRPTSDLLIENSSSEIFVSRLKTLQPPSSISGLLDTTHVTPSRQPHNRVTKATAGQNSPNEYFPLSFDTTHSGITFKLPPYQYVQVLIDQFDTYLGHDFHWYLRRTLRKRLDMTYKVPGSTESKDRIWLCRLLVIFALGESYSDSLTPVIRFTPNPTQDLPRPPPGTEFFEQALELLKINYEEPTIDHVEALNLIVFYSYSLNRKKAAYMYSGLSTRMSNMLMLHKRPPPSTYSNVEVEHRKRLWWTTYCLDRMTSTEMGCAPAFPVNFAELSYPANINLSAEEVGEFNDPDCLRTRVELAFINAEIVDIVNNLREDDSADAGELMRPIIQELHAVRARFPTHMSFDVTRGMPEIMTQKPEARSLGSLYLRYNQCFVYLLRPLFLKSILNILSGKPKTPLQEDTSDLYANCLQAARSNLLILIDLWRCEKIAKFGFWDALHLFSGLLVFSLAKTVNKWRPGSLHEEYDDLETFTTGKDILQSMIEAGSLASKGFCNMLNDVEAFGRDASDAGDLTGLYGSENWSVDDWITQMLEMDRSSSVFDMLSGQTV